MSTRHAAIWIDHNEAHAIALDLEGPGHRMLAHVKAHDTHTHPKKLDGHRHPADPRFLVAAEDLIAACELVVLFGPGQAKDELVQHLESTESPLRGRVASVATLDRVTDGELAARAREIFRAIDAMRGVHVGARGLS